MMKGNNQIERIGTIVLLAGLAIGAPWAPAAAQAPAFLVKDINSVPSWQNSDPGQLMDVDGTLYFAASTQTTGRELWKSDGTEAGTVLVKDIYPGQYGSDPRSLTNVNGALFFTANGNELWKSDGTESGTVLVKKFATGLSAVRANVNGMLFFAVLKDEASGEGVGVGFDLWESDGTEAGTVLVKKLPPMVHPGDFSNVNGTLFFTIREPGSEIWKSDGTESGTVPVKAIDAQNLTNVNGTLFFTAPTGDVVVCMVGCGFFELCPVDVPLQGLWKSDGAEASTVLVKQIGASNLTNVDGTLFFLGSSGDDCVQGSSVLWRSDGTEGGTVPVNGAAGAAALLTEVSGTLFFVADGGIWKTDVTQSEPVRVKEIQDVQNLASVNGTLLFVTYGVGPLGGFWRSDGTEVGTLPISSFTLPSLPQDLAYVNESLFFTVYVGAGRLELWKSDENGTGPVKELGRGTDSSHPRNLTAVNGTVFFVADDGVLGQELWKTDGTDDGTVLVRDIHSGSASSFPYDLTNVQGTLFFSADDGAHGGEFSRQLWRTDGSGDSTVVIKAFSGGIGEFTNVNGTLFFLRFDGGRGRELWRSDGTESGTVLVSDISARILRDFFNLENLTNVNGTLFFTVNIWDDPPVGINRIELWKSDGSEPGSMMVKVIGPGRDRIYPEGFTSVNGTLFFLNDKGLWNSDGTEAGTVVLKAIENAFGLVNVDGTLFFAVRIHIDDPAPADEIELWKSDGTETGTVQVKANIPGQLSGLPHLAANVNGSVSIVFVMYNGAGEDLWRSDGTEAGTLPIKGTSIDTTYLTNASGTLFFTTEDGLHGRELWKTDGTAAGTVLVADVAVPGGSNPSEGVATDSMLFFSATTDDTGTELWALPLSLGPGPTTTPTAPTPTSSATATRTPVPCIGDCSATGVVSIPDLITGVGIALGILPPSACPTFLNAGGTVDIAQLVEAVNNALNGCGNVQ